MDPIFARQLIENLSKGLDPYIGRKLSDQDICSNPDIQLALQIVLDCCTIENADQQRARKTAEKIVERELRNQERYMRYPNSGKPWSEDDIIELKLMYLKKYSIYHIANIMKRSPEAIKSQLKKHGLVPIYKEKG